MRDATMRMRIRRPATVALAVAAALCCVVVFACMMSAPVAVSAATTTIALRAIAESLGAQVLNDAIAAYGVVRPEVKISLEFGPNTRSTQTKAAVFTNRYDFGTVGSYLSAAELSQNPNVTVLPLLATAMAPVYRIDDWSARAGQVLQLTRSAFARIMMGNITRWNDATIAASNPSNTLPDQPITVVMQNAPSGSTPPFLAGLQKFEPQLFAQTIASTSATVTNWPFSRYAAYKFVPDVPGVVASTPYSIGYASLPNAQAIGLSTASVYNGRGALISPNANSVEFAMLDGGGTLSSLQDLTDAGGGGSWPIALTGFLIFNRASPSTRGYNSSCEQMTEMLNFFDWLFISGSDISFPVANTDGVVLIPKLIRDKLSVTKLISTARCRDSVTGVDEPVSVTSTGTVRIATTPLLGVLNDILPSFYASVAPAVKLSLSTISDGGGAGSYVGPVSAAGLSSSSEALRRVLATPRTADLALVAPQQLNASDRAAAAEAGVQLIPAFSAVIQLNAYFGDITLPTSNPNVVLTLDLVSRIFSGKVSSWLHADIVALNPSFVTLFAGKDVNITVVVCCAPSRTVQSMGALFTRALYDYTVASGDATGGDWAAAGPGTGNAAAFSWDALIQRAVVNTPGDTSVPRTRYVVAADELALSSVSPNTAHSLSYFVKQTPAVASTEVVLAVPLAGSVAIAVDPSGGVGGTYRIVNSSLSTQISCAAQRPYDALAADENGSGALVSRPPSCWPFTSVLSFASYASYSDATATAEEKAVALSQTPPTSGSTLCPQPKAALQYVQWLSRDSALSAASDSRGIVRMGAVSDSTSSAITNSLQSVTCEGQNLLVTFPARWQVSSQLQVAAITLGAVGVALCVLAFAVTCAYRKQPVLVAASVPFVLLSLLGLLLLFCALFAIAKSPVPTRSSCSAMNWLANLGFTLCFGPMFVKTWRIWMIFANKRLRSVRLDNKLLFVPVALLLLYDVIVLAIWESSSYALEPIESLRGDTADEPGTIYTGCGIRSSDGATNTGWVIVGLILAEKGLLLLFGTAIGVSTRKVVGSYNESRLITFSIYNVVLAFLVCATIIEGTSAVGDTLLGLFIFMVCYPALVTWALTFLPKMWTAMPCFDNCHKPKDVIGTPSNPAAARMFTMFGLEAMEYDGVTKYIAALTAELQAAQRRQAVLPRPSGRATGSGQPHAAVSKSGGGAVSISRAAPSSGGGSGGAAGTTQKSNRGTLRMPTQETVASGGPSRQGTVESVRGSDADAKDKDKADKEKEKELIVAGASSAGDGKSLEMTSVAVAVGAGPSPSPMPSPVPKNHGPAAADAGFAGDTVGVLSRGNARLESVFGGAAAAAPSNPNGSTNGSGGSPANSSIEDDAPPPPPTATY